MAAFVSVKQRVAAIVLVTLGTIGATGLAPGWSGRQQGAAPTPLQLFQKLLPVIRHDRCMNCHGGVDPISGEDHEGGAIDTVSTSKGFEACGKCHKTHPDWHRPSEDHFFVGKSDQELCRLFEDFASKMGHPFFISNHLKGDEFIIAAFAALMGGARAPKDFDPQDKPPMDQAAFIQVAKDWLTQGHGACEVLGTIYLEESVNSVDTVKVGPTETRLGQQGTRTVTLTLNNGKYYADIKTDYTITQVSVMHLANARGACDVIVKLIQHHTGGGTGIATVTIKDTTLFGDTSPPQTDYRVDISLPSEKTQKTENNSIVDGCGTGAPPPSVDAQSFDWDGTSFVLEGHVHDPKTEGRVGSCDKIVKFHGIGTTKTFADDPEACLQFGNVGNSWMPGLMDRLATTFHDGTDVPYHVVAKWHLKFR
jgi:hypothetical protein